MRDAIAAANRIVGKPYRYGGGHARFNDVGYDCSGTVSLALHGGALLDTPLPSGGFNYLSLRDIARDANWNNVSIYPFDPTGLTTSPACSRTTRQASTPTRLAS